jgi:SAM-dependent methyltransferase
MSGSDSGYTGIDRTADPAVYVRRLDQVAATGFWRAVKQTTYALLELGRGNRALDIGCGTGDDAMALAEFVRPTGRAVGVDVSATMVAEAQVRAEARGLGACVEFHQADAMHLPFPDASFDACRAERVLQHIDAPQAVVTELARVCRPGGRIVLVEPDYGSLAIHAADQQTTARIVRCRIEHFRSGRVGSQLPRLCSNAGLVDVQTSIRILESRGPVEGAERHQLQQFAADAVEAGAVTGTEATAWVAALASAAGAGVYRQALAVFLVRALKP